MKRLATIGALLLMASLSNAVAYADDDSDDGGNHVTVIHTGDFHGHFIPRANVRSDRIGNSPEGGLARVYSVIKDIREESPNALLLHTGDTIQGSAEVLYTRGQAMVDVLNGFGIDAYAPGNWEFVYGPGRFLELFAGSAPLANWGALAANAYYDTGNTLGGTPGTRLLPAYKIKQVGKVKVGIMGFTTARGIPAVGPSATKGVKFTNGEAEAAQLVPHLRNVEKVDLVVMISELGLAHNIRIAEITPGINVILSSDMHEESRKPVVTRTGTIVVEEGQDGTMMGKLKLKVKNGRLVKWKWKAINVTDDIEADEDVAEQITDLRKTFVSGPDFVQHVNPINGAKLKRPIDTVVGYTVKPLHRSNFAGEDMPAVVEGSSHDFITDAIRAVAGVNFSSLRGFRFGTHVPPGPIKMEDLYHFVPIGPQIAKGTVRGQAIINQIERSAHGAFDVNVQNWTGGWLFNFSGVTFDLDPYKPLATNPTPPRHQFLSKASNVLVNGVPLVASRNYTFASYWFASEAGLINGVQMAPGTPAPVVIKDTDGGPLDGVEVVVQYLQSLPNQTADTQLNRIRLLAPLPLNNFGFAEMQPLRGSAP